MPTRRPQAPQFPDSTPSRTDSGLRLEAPFLNTLEPLPRRLEAFEQSSRIAPARSGAKGGAVDFREQGQADPEQAEEVFPNPVDRKRLRHQARKFVEQILSLYAICRIRHQNMDRSPEPADASKPLKTQVGEVRLTTTDPTIVPRKSLSLQALFTVKFISLVGSCLNPDSSIPH